MVADAAELVLFAAGRMAGRVDVRVGPGAPGFVPLHISDGKVLEVRASYRPHPSLLRSESYVAAAAGALAALGLSAPTAPGSADAKMLDRLTDFRLEVIAQEARRVSSALAQAPRDPQLHEQASLCLAALALKESAGVFQDPREPVRRSLAHLALARALRPTGELGLVGGVAEAVLSASAGRGASARAQMELLARRWPPAAGFESWRQAVEIAATDDWRVLKAPLTATLLERSIHYRALHSRVGSLKALDFVTSRNTVPITEWSRTGLRSSSVESGNVLTQIAVPLELKELTEVAKVHERQTQATARLGALLGPSGGRCLVQTSDGTWQPEVVSWGIWSGHFQRHLMHAFYASYLHQANTLGRPEAATTLRQALPEVIGGMEQYPMLVGRLAWESHLESEGDKRKPAERAPDAIRAARRFALANPLKVPAEQWFLMVDDASGLPRDPGQMPYSDWFGVGSARSFTASFFARYLSNLMDNAEVERLVLENPHDVSVLDAHVKRLFGERELTLGLFDEHYGPTAAFDVGLMRRRAELLEAIPIAYIQQVRKIAEFRPDELLNAGLYLAERNLEESAAQVLGEAVQTARDDVGLSHYCSWYLDYLWRNGRQDEARALARRIAATYSYPGLAEMAVQYEREGNLDRAQEYYEKLQERYDGGEDLRRSFYFRHRDRFKEKGGVATRELFPDGVRALSLQTVSGEPLTGLYIGPGGIAFTSRGLPAKGIIAAIDGLAVTTWEQYRALRQEPRGTRTAAAMERRRLARGGSRHPR